MFSTILLFMAIAGDTILKIFAQFVSCPTDDTLSVCLGISLVARYFNKNINILGTLALNHNDLLVH